LGYVNNPIVETDTFRIYSTTCFLHCSNPSTYGLYLDNGTGYSVRDNYFTKYGSGFTNLIYGTIANNTQNTDIIYRNTFKSVNYGNQAQFQNYIYNGAFPYNDNGLQYYCNTFVDSTISNADIFVPGTLSGSNIGTGTTTYSAGIGFNQGYGNSGTPANGGNHFSHTPSGVDYYIDTVVNRTYNSVYLYNCGGSCTGSPYIPRTYRNLSPSATTYTYNCALNIYTCPGCRTTDPNQALLSQADSYLQTYNSLQTQIDGGNTSNLLSFVNNNGNAQAVYNSLNAAAPYISDEVLEAYINGNYPSSDIAQILTACSPLTDNVNNIVKASALSSAIKTQINSSQTGKSKMGQLKTEMSAAFTSRHLILDEVIRAYINDTIPANVKKGYAIMKVKALELPAKNQVQVGIDIHDSAMAANALNQVQNAEGQSNYVKLHTILLQNLSVPAEQLMQNASVLNDVLAMATDSSDRFTYYKANALLQTVGKSNYVPYVQPANTPSNTPNGANQRTTTSIETPVLSQSTLINQPNPFKESTTVKVNVVEKSENAYIVVSDMVGNEVARYQVQQGENNITINAGSLNQSVMFCTLVIDGKRIKTNKMVLIK
ncbi:MAG TPA: hypothetical protein VKG26_07945, partial [Bacteroidia bacterium]|nr:hypothetical protein [Bacteroidia bacterium]